MIINTMMTAVDSRWPAYLILAVYLAAMVVIAIISRKKSTSLSSFYMSDRGMGGWMSAFAYGTTYFSAVIFIGYAGKFGMTMGLAAFWIGICNAFIGSMLAWLVLAKRTRSMSRQLDSKTMPEFFERRYDNKYLKLLSSIIIFVFLIPYSTSVYQGLGYIVGSVFGIPFTWCIVILASITALYLFVGGYFAETMSDFIQGIIMLLGVGLMLIFIFKSDYVKGIEGLDKLNEMGFGFFPTYISDSGKFIDSPGFNLIIMCLLTSFGIWSLPQSIHKFYTIRDNKAIKKGVVVSTLFALVIGGGAYLNGGLARLFFPEMPAGGTDQIIVNMFEMANFSPALLGLIAVLVMSASMSTLSSLSLTSASTVSIDIYQGFVKKSAPDQQVKWILRILCIVFIAISALLAILQVDAIVTLMSLSWGTIAGCFMGPYVYGLYSKKATAAGAFASMISSLVITFALVLVFGFTQTENVSFGEVIKSGIGRSPLIGVIAMMTSMIVTPLVSLFTKKPPQAVIEKSFAPLNEK